MYGENYNSLNFIIGSENKIEERENEMISRIHYIVVFAIIYVLFSLILFIFAKSNVRLTFNGVYKENFNYSVREYIIIFIIVFIASIKMNFGSDYWSYSVIYNKALELYSSVSDIISSRGGLIGSGLYVMAFLMKSFTQYIGWNSALENNLIFIVVSIFSTCIVFRQIRKNSFSFEWSVTTYFFMGYFMIANNILKQQVAMSLMMVAYDCLEEKKYVRYIIICFGACLFHSTALVPSILFPIIRLVKLNDKVVKVISGICIGIMALLPYSIRFFSNITSLFDAKYIDNFTSYSNSTIGRIYVIGSLVVYIYIFSICYKNREYMLGKYDKTISYLSLLAVGIFINFISINFWLAIRISLYFYQFVIFALPNFIEKSNMSRVVKRNIKILLLIFCVFYVFFSWDNHYFGFHTIWSDMKPAYLPNYISKYE